MKLNKQLLNKLVKNQLSKVLKEEEYRPPLGSKPMGVGEPEEEGMDFTVGDMEREGYGGFDKIIQHPSYGRVLDLEHITNFGEAFSAAKEKGEKFFQYGGKGKKGNVYHSNYKESPSLQDKRISAAQTTPGLTPVQRARETARFAVDDIESAIETGKPRGEYVNPGAPAGGSWGEYEQSGADRLAGVDAALTAAEGDEMLLDLGLYDGEDPLTLDQISQLGVTDPDSDEGQIITPEEAGVNDDIRRVMRDTGWTEEDVRRKIGDPEFKAPKSADDALFDSLGLNESLISYFAPARNRKKKIKTRFIRR